MKKNSRTITTPSQIFVGAFPLGCIAVDLYALTHQFGGCFFTNPDGKAPPRIKVSIEYDRWDSVVEVLLHEALELSMSLKSLRYERSGVAGDASSYTFLFDHTQFVDLCDCAASFITPAMPRLATIHRDYHAKLSAKKPC